MTHQHQPQAPSATEAIDAPVYPEALRLLESRRTLPLRSLAGPGPTPEELRRLLTIAARVPDHGRLAPWRFIVIEGRARETFGRRVDARYAEANPDLPAIKADMWTAYMLRAPVTIVLVSRPDPLSKISVFEQELSAGAAGMALTVAAHAMGFATHWLLKWPGKDPAATSLLGIGETEKVAGFIHLGRPAEVPADRPRPALEDVVTYWDE
jgi:nitroreductase